MKKYNMENMKRTMRKVITRGSLLMEMAEDSMNLMTKAKIFKNISKKK
ncbi:hypothetical protein [Clostridium vincentii]|uniref:Uncharacterized protein n=1 Tax=Clostridium vincentii TaxID=52704 RepID=A0A2T0BF79_9CLOT|nr:hypothetical protein [Clostridium vincentii]PRR82551.1 hypothetical protein CLVI_16860 [Clostridium vincentii]